MNENLYGIMAEFGTPEQLLAAARTAHKAGYRKMDAYSPYAVEVVSEAICFTKRACRWSSSSVESSAA